MLLQVQLNFFIPKGVKYQKLTFGKLQKIDYLCIGRTNKLKTYAIKIEIW